MVMRKLHDERNGGNDYECVIWVQWIARPHNIKIPCILCAVVQDGWSTASPHVVYNIPRNIAILESSVASESSRKVFSLRLCVGQNIKHNGSCNSVVRLNSYTFKRVWGMEACKLWSFAGISRRRARYTPCLSLWARGRRVKANLEGVFYAGLAHELTMCTNIVSTLCLTTTLVWSWSTVKVNALSISLLLQSYVSSSNAPPTSTSCHAKITHIHKCKS